MPRHPTSTLLAALKARLEALQWTPDGGDPEALFQQVKYYAEPDLVKALAEIRVIQNRCCLIVPDANEYRNDQQGRSMITGVERTVFLVLTDRDYAQAQDALLGDASRPGVIVMEETVVDDVTGVNLGLRGVRVKPERGESVFIGGDDAKKIPGRRVRTLELAIEAGETITTNNT